MGITLTWVEERDCWWLIDRAHKPRKVTVFHVKKFGGTKESAHAAAQLAAASLDEQRKAQAAVAAANAEAFAGAGKPILGAVALHAWHAARKGGVGTRHRDNTLSLIENHLEPFFGELDLRTLTQEQVEEFAGTMARKDKASGDGKLGRHTILGALRVLSATCHWLERKRDPDLGFKALPGIRGIGDAVARKQAFQGDREAWTHEEADHLLLMAKSTALYPLLLAALHTGARKGELLGLDWSTVNLHGSRRVRPHFKVRQVLTPDNELKPAPKTDNSRRDVELSPQLLELLRALARERAAQAGLSAQAPGLVFRSSTGEPWSYSGMNKSWERLRDRAFGKYGVRPLPFHSFRHTYVSWALDSHVNLGWLCKQVGDDPETLLGTYKHFVGDSSSDHSFLSAPDAAARPALSLVEASGEER